MVAPLKTVRSYWAKGIWGDWFPHLLRGAGPHLEFEPLPLALFRALLSEPSETLGAGKGVVDVLGMHVFKWLEKDTKKNVS